MIEHLQVFRAEFKCDCGSSSLIFAVKNLEDAPDCINDHEERTGDTFIKISDPCVMTPTLYTRD